MAKIFPTQTNEQCKEQTRQTTKTLCKKKTQEEEWYETATTVTAVEHRMCNVQMKKKNGICMTQQNHHQCHN